MAVSPHGESSFFPGGGDCCVDGAVKLLFLCFVSVLGLDGWAVSGFGHGDGASFFSSCAGDRVRFVLLPSFSGVGYVVGGRVPVLFCWRVVYSDSISCRRFGFGDFFIAGFSCIDARIFCVPSWVVCCPCVNGDAQSALQLGCCLEKARCFYRWNVHRICVPPRSFPLEVKAPPALVCGPVFLYPLCGIVACWPELAGDATGVCSQ